MTTPTGGKPVDLAAVMARYQAYCELWPEQHAGQTLNERVAAAKRCAGDIPSLVGELQQLRDQITEWQGRADLVLQHFDQAEAEGYPRNRAARASVHLPTLRKILTREDTNPA